MELVFEVVAYVQDDASPPSCLDPREEGPELASYLKQVGSCGTVAGQFQVDCGCQSLLIGLSDVEKVVCLSGAARAKCEEMVRATLDPGRPGPLPVLREPWVREIGSFRR